MNSLVASSRSSAAPTPVVRVAVSAGQRRYISRKSTQKVSAELKSTLLSRLNIQPGAQPAASAQRQDVSEDLVAEYNALMALDPSQGQADLSRFVGAIERFWTENRGNCSFLRMISEIFLIYSRKQTKSARPHARNGKEPVESLWRTALSICQRELRSSKIFISIILIRLSLRAPPAPPLLSVRTVSNIPALFWIPQMSSIYFYE